jgi:two-component system, cell cycle sensor histidine kinase DivJ
VSFLTPVWSYVDALVHPSAQQDALTAVRHRAFIAPRLLGSFVALASFPVYVAIRGVPTALELGIFSWFMSPILIVHYLSRTGHYESAHILSSLSLTGIATLVALCTGGIGSFAAIWLVAIPLEAALSASRRVVMLAATFALSACGILLMLGVIGLLPQPVTTPEQHGTLAALGIICATIYSTGLALGVGLLLRTSLSLLDAEEDRYHLLANTMSDVIVRQGRNGSVLSVSPAAEMLIGGQVNELLGNGLFDRVHVADRPAYLAALADAASLNEERVVEFRLRRGVQQFVWVEMRCRLRDALCGKRDYADCEIVAVLSDISDRKFQERAVGIARAELEHANAEKSRLMATVSHELRTPLNAIIGFSEMLTNETIELDSGRKFEYARLIKESGRHLLAVVNGILDVSKMGTGNFEISPEPFAPAPAVEDCTDLLALKAHEAGVELRLSLSPDLPEVAADRRAFNQILINLIANAVKFTPRGGRVTVSARREGLKLALTVEDTGVGIGEADLPRLGEAFFRACTSRHGVRDGAGLGLSIVKGLVHLHNGEIEIKSRLDEGTRVTVRLPFDCQTRRGVNDPVKLVPEQNRGAPTAVYDRMKKSA